MDLHAAFTFVENFLGFQLRELSRALLLRTDLTRGCGWKDRSNALLGQATLLHFAHSAELRHILAVNALRAIVSAARFALFASNTLVSIFGSDGLVARIDWLAGGGIRVVVVDIVRGRIVVGTGQWATEKDGGRRMKGDDVRSGRGMKRRMGRKCLLHRRKFTFNAVLQLGFVLKESHSLILCHSGEQANCCNRLFRALRCNEPAFADCLSVSV